MQRPLNGDPVSISSTGIEIEFPLEFVVAGTAVSLQTKRRESLEEWKDRIRAASRTVLPESHFATDDPLAITLYYFPDSDMQGDIDNIQTNPRCAWTTHLSE
jgi:crossover junction endodeoxyribonuclease RusA